MQKNRLSGALTQNDQDRIKSFLAEISIILKPFIQGLSIEERQTLPKMKDKTIPFGDKVLSYCDSNPEFAPNFLDKAELKKDLVLAKALKPIWDAVSVLYSDIDDTMMLAGSEAYEGSLFYYHSVKYAAKKGNVAAKPIIEDLAKRFPGPKSRQKKEEPAPKP